MTKGTKARRSRSVPPREAGAGAPPPRDTIRLNRAKMVQTGCSELCQGNSS
jgi:hypothetical protein